ncbi:MAG TPA: hypothetical protein VD735_06865 [Candidatus Saccharimonadales bacterium]|nr:hypothetical protein [Candidatus Saccharimonadales bacterium]
MSMSHGPEFTRIDPFVELPPQETRTAYDLQPANQAAELARLRGTHDMGVLPMTAGLNPLTGEARAAMDKVELRKPDRENGARNLAGLVARRTIQS